MSELPQGVISIHGKLYESVALRVSKFRSEHTDYSLVTEIISDEDDLVVMKATIADPEGRIRATGYAQEKRGLGNINKTSALENCETSAIGRALACFGYTGESFASSDEMTAAMAEQISVEHIDYMAIVRDHFESIASIKLAILEQDYSSAVEAFEELGEDVKRALWKAPSKGGVFTTKEREVMRSDEWGAAIRAFKGTQAA